MCAWNRKDIHTLPEIAGKSWQPEESRSSKPFVDDSEETDRLRQAEKSMKKKKWNEG